MEEFNYSGSPIISDAKGTPEIKPRIFMAKQHSTRITFPPEKCT
jgi:hypothetical protein